MMIKYFVLVIAVLCISCKNQKEVQELNYPDETIRDVMIDLYVAAEALKDLNPTVQDSLRNLYSEQIEQVHNVDLDKIESDIESLLKFPKRYKEIHQDAKDSVSVWLDRYDTKKKKKLKE